MTLTGAGEVISNSYLGLQVRSGREIRADCVRPSTVTFWELRLYSIEIVSFTRCL